jgi:hypothetical protein
VGSAESATPIYTADEQFTDRDLEQTADLSEAVYYSVSTGQDITITSAGVYVLSGEASNVTVYVEAGKDDKVQLVLDGVSVTNESFPVIYIKSADKVFITTNADNTLSVTGTFVSDGNTNTDGVIFSKSDLTLNGTATLTVSSTDNGIVGKDDVKIAGGTLEITAAKHGVQANDSARFAEAEVNITAGTDGVHVSDSADAEEGTASDSYFYIADATVSIEAGDDGIHADAQALIEGGSITVSESYEGIEALEIEISGGDIDVTASDDGLNAAGGNTTTTTQSGSTSDSAQTTDAQGSTFGDDDWAGGKGGFPGGGGFSDGGTDGKIEISGGSTHITAGGDGVDANGSVTISGGTTIVEGPTSGDTSVIDFNGAGTITGGTFIGTGGAGMAESFSSAENQGLIAVSVGNQSAGQTVTLTDADGSVIAEQTPELDYAVVYISTADLQQGGTYTLTAGSYSETIELTDAIYTTLSGGMGGGMMGGHGGMRGGNGGPQDGGQSSSGDAAI